MSKQFTHGCIIVNIVPMDELFASLLELPNVIATELSLDQSFKTDLGLRVDVVEGSTASEVHATLESPALEIELVKFLKAEGGMDQPKFFPPLKNMKFQLTFPDFKLGELYGAGMKMYAKMNLGTGYAIRMYRTHRTQPLLSTIGVFGRWDCGGEFGVFSIEGPKTNNQTLLFCERHEIADELAVEFQRRWPMWPAAEFRVMDYQEIEPILALSNRQ